ncbi:MAG: hypothetical protein U9Q99_00775 [Nanoarchaeota archaeon]|nr:hypothetical protein [Nanoarchaeota archaeon]
MSDLNYKVIRKKCINYYFKNDMKNTLFDKTINFNPEHFNAKAEISYKSEFEKFDLTRLAEGRFSSEEYIFFIIQKSFNPINEHLFRRDVNNKGSWGYKGLIFKIEELENINYLATLRKKNEDLNLVYSED